VGRLCHDVLRLCECALPLLVMPGLVPAMTTRVDSQIN
jgi:hypothetical protein